MTALFICGVWRVAVCAAYLAVACFARDVAEDMLIPAAILALTVALYDAAERIHRA